MKRFLLAVLLAALAVPLVGAVLLLPPRGAPDTPVHTHVAAHYLAEGRAETGSDNLVTAVLLNYRGFDTFGEVVVIFTALAASLAVLLGVAGRRRPAPRRHRDVAPSGILVFVVRLLAPFIAMFGLFVLLRGHITPGGGLQGAAILGALGIALTLVLGAEAVRRVLPIRLASWLQAAGPIAFVVVGTLGLWLTGAALGYPTEPARHLTRELMLIGLDLGIGVGGATILTSLFLLLERP